MATSADAEITRRWPAARVVATPLDLLMTLDELDTDGDATVVLAGDFARDRAYASFLHEAYPELAVIVDSERPERALFVPAFA